MWYIQLIQLIVFCYFLLLYCYFFCYQVYIQTTEFGVCTTNIGVNLNMSANIMKCCLMDKFAEKKLTCNTLC